VRSYSPDGQRLLVEVGEDSHAVLDGTTGRLVAELAQSGARMLAPAFSAAGRFVFNYFGGAEEVIIWNSADGEVVHNTGPIDGQSLLMPAFPPNDAFAALPPAPSAAMSLVNLATGEHRSIKNSKRRPEMVAFTADGGYAIGAGCGGVQAWSTHDGGAAGALAWPSELVGVSPDGRWLAVMSDVTDHDGRHFVWLIAMNRLTSRPWRWLAAGLSRLRFLRPAHTLKAGPGAPERIQFSDDGTVMSIRFWGSRAKLGRIEIWRMGASAPLKAFNYETGVVDAETGWSGLSAGRPAWLAYANRNEIVLDRIGSDGPVAAIPGNPSGVCLSVRDGCLDVACVSPDGTVGLYELAGRRAP